MAFQTSGFHQPFFAAALAALGLIACQSTAFAHITLATGEARSNATYKAVLKVPHGCGGEATQSLRVQIPDGVIGVKPMPKPGWSLKVTRGPYGKSYQSHGKAVSEGAREIVWSGGTLPDDNYDEFTFVGFVTPDFAVGSTIYFPVVQECTKGETRWVDVPASGQSAHDLKAPAPGVRVVADMMTVGQAPMDHGNMDHGNMDHGKMDHDKMGAMPPVAAGGDTFTVGDLSVTAPWTRATPGGAKIAGGYFKVTNNGKQADRLIKATSTVADHAEIHEMSMTGGVMKMRPLADGLIIKPGETVELKPGGFHMMFMDLKQPLKQGETMKATLIFEKAGKLDVTFKVNSLGATEAPMHKH